MGRKTDAYVDTSALIAFVDRSDSHHLLFRRLFSEPPPLITTTLVVAEGHGWRAVTLLVAGVVALLLPLVAFLVRDRPSDLGVLPYGAAPGTAPVTVTFT